MYRVSYDYWVDDVCGTLTASFSTIDECREWIHEMWLEGITVNYPRIERVAEPANWLLEGF